jgi:hypothetical protein
MKRPSAAYETKTAPDGGVSAGIANSGPGPMILSRRAQAAALASETGINERGWNSKSRS